MGWPNGVAGPRRAADPEPGGTGLSPGAAWDPLQSAAPSLPQTQASEAPRSYHPSRHVWAPGGLPLPAWPSPHHSTTAALPNFKNLLNVK